MAWNISATIDSQSVIDWSCVGFRPVNCFSSASPGAHTVDIGADAAAGEAVFVRVDVGIVVREV